MAAKVKKGDQVMVIAGKDKGKKGEVKLVLPTENRVVVEGVHEDEPPRGLEAARLRVGVVVGGAVQDHLGAERDGRLHLDERRRLRHHDRRVNAQPLRVHRHALRVISGRCEDDAALPLVRREQHQAIGRAALLE